MISCPVKETLGVPCPGCGFQRSFWALAEGDILTSIEHYPALLPFFGLLVFTGLHLKFKYKNGHKVIVAVFCVTLFLITFGFANSLRKDYKERKAETSSQ